MEGFGLTLESKALSWFQAIIKNLFWYIFNLKYDFISLELIILERENTMEAK